MYYRGAIFFEHACALQCTPFTHSTCSSPITYGTCNLILGLPAYNRMPGGGWLEPRGVSEGCEESLRGMRGPMLDFDLAGAEGAYLLVKNLKNAPLNKAIDKLIEEAGATKATTLKQYQQCNRGSK